MDEESKVQNQAVAQETTDPITSEAVNAAEDADAIEFYSYDRDCPKRKGEHIVTLAVAAPQLKTIQKQAEQAFGQMLLNIEKDTTANSRADRLSHAEGQVESARETVEELREELQSWRENLPENLQDGTKAQELDEAIDSLGNLADSLDYENFDFEIDMPGMF